MKKKKKCPLFSRPLVFLHLLRYFPWPRIDMKSRSSRQAGARDRTRAVLCFWRLSSSEVMEIRPRLSMVAPVLLESGISDSPNVLSKSACSRDILSGSNRGRLLLSVVSVSFMPTPSSVSLRSLGGISNLPPCLRAGVDAKNRSNCVGLVGYILVKAGNREGKNMLAGGYDGER